MLSRLPHLFVVLLSIIFFTESSPDVAQVDTAKTEYINIEIYDEKVLYEILGSRVLLWSTIFIM